MVKTIPKNLTTLSLFENTYIVMFCRWSLTTPSRRTAPRRWGMPARRSTWRRIRTHESFHVSPFQNIHFRCKAQFLANFAVKKNDNIFAKILIASSSNQIDLLKVFWKNVTNLIFENIWNGPNGILWGWRETDSWKNQKKKISWHCPFISSAIFGKFHGQKEW